MSNNNRSSLLALVLLFVIVLSACGGAFDEKVTVPADAGDSASDDGAAEANDSAEPREADTGSADSTTVPETSPPTTFEAEPAEVAPEQVAQLRKVVEEVVTDLAPGTDSDQCVLDGLVADPELLESALQLEVSQSAAGLPLQSQLVLYRLLLDCAGPELVGAEVGAGFAEGAGLATTPGELSECFGAELVAADGPLVLAGLVAIGEDLAPPSETRDPLVSTLSTCVPAELLIDFAVDELSEDVTFTDALDVACIESANTGDVSTAGIWEAFIDNPELDFTELDPEVTSGIFGPLFDCISLGTVIAEEAAADGIILSATTIQCLDAKFAELDIFSKFLAGEAPDDATLGAAVIGCLSPEEIEALGGL